MNRANELSDRTEATPATAKSLRLSPVPVERLDEYVVVARLGSGGMAEVILGLAQGPQGFRKLVAIKRLHTHCEGDPELVRMFLHEASLAALLQHPNIVQTHKVGSADGRHFIAMEYLEGQPLHHALPRLRDAAGGLDPVLAARIVADALSGLAYAHDAVDYAGTPLGFVHRDVSPQNLFISYDGQVKLLDFGVSKASAAALDLYTRPGMIKGKLGYIAPEQASGQADRRADLWSAGVVLWEALAGVRLFRGDDAAAKLRAALNDEIPPLRALRPDLAEPLAQVVDRALQRDRDKRYASAVEMKCDLDAWLASEQNSSLPGFAPDAFARTALASAMQSRFAHEVRERRAAVLECFAAVEHEQHWRQLEQTGAGVVRATVRSSAVPEEPRSRSAKQSVRLVGLSALLLLLGSIALVASAPKPHTARVEVRRVLPGDARPERSAPASATIGARAEDLDVARPQAASPQRSEARAVVEAQSAASVRRALPVRVTRPVSAALKSKEPVDVSVEAPSESTALENVPARGRLRLEASPYAVVSLEGKRLGITPIDVELPASVHTLTLRNPERGIETTYRVQVVAGESLLRRVELE